MCKVDKKGEKYKKNSIGPSTKGTKGLNSPIISMVYFVPIIAVKNISRRPACEGSK
jgi:hypothetical protein